MRVISAAIILAVSLPAGIAVAASTPDQCIAQKTALRTAAVEACQGLRYLFNPSGCFIAQKALNAFDVDKCQATAATEQTVPVAPQTVPAVVPPQTVTAPAPPQTVPASVPPPRSAVQENAPHEAAVPETDVAQLKAENARLKVEIVRLKAEMEQLRGK